MKSIFWVSLKDLIILVPVLPCPSKACTAWFKHECILCHVHMHNMRAHHDFFWTSLHLCNATVMIRSRAAHVLASGFCSPLA